MDANDQPQEYKMMHEWMIFSFRSLGGKLVVYFFISILISFSIMMQNHVKWKHKSNLSYRSWMQCELIVIEKYFHTITICTFSIQHCVTKFKIKLLSLYIRFSYVNIVWGKCKQSNFQVLDEMWNISKLKNGKTP